MTLWLMALAALYGIVAFATACRVTTLLAWHFVLTHNSKLPGNQYWEISIPGGEQWVGGAVLGLAAGLTWPLVAVVFTMRGWLFAPPRDVQIERQRQQIAALERELEIR